MAGQGGLEASKDPPESAQGRSAGELPLDVIFETLSNRRRRMVLRYLISESDATTLGDLAEHVAGLENGKPEAELSSAERKRVYIVLYQCHLPKMDDAGVIDFDGDRKTVEVGGNFEAVERFLPGEDGVEREGRTATFAGWARNAARRLGTLAST